MIYHGTTPIISMFVGTKPVLEIAKGTEEVTIEETSNFILADNSIFLTSSGDTFLAKEE